MSDYKTRLTLSARSDIGKYVLIYGYKCLNNTRPTTVEYLDDPALRCFETKTFALGGGIHCVPFSYENTEYIISIQVDLAKDTPNRMIVILVFSPFVEYDKQADILHAFVHAAKENVEQPTLPQNVTMVNHPSWDYSLKINNSHIESLIILHNNKPNSRFTFTTDSPISSVRTCMAHLSALSQDLIQQIETDEIKDFLFVINKITKELTNLIKDT